MYDVIATLLNSQWLIHHDAVLGYIPSFFSFINGNPLVYENSLIAKNEKKPFAIAQSGNISLVNRWDLQDENLPDNSIAVIPIQGALTSSDTMNIACFVQQAEQNPNVIAILFLINSPGGMVFYTDIAAGIIKNASKPKIGFVLNMCCSAAMWLASGMDRIFVSSELDKLGSIGVMTNIYNISSFLKDKLGIDIEEIYASKSEKKNFQWRELISGNKQPIIADLDFTNEIFHRTIIENLSIDKSSPVFEGDTYFARNAIQHGLAHEINSIEYAVEYALKMGLTSSLKKSFNR